MVLLKTNLFEATTVSPEDSKRDIEGLLSKFGITERRFVETTPDKAYLEFTLVRGDKNTLKIRIDIPYGEEVRRGSLVHNKSRSYRILFHYVKGLFSMNETGIKPIEELFMAHIVTANNDGKESTLGEQLSISLATGATPVISLPSPIMKSNDSDEILSLIGQ